MITKKITIHNEEYEITASTIRGLDALEKHLIDVISLRQPKPTLNSRVVAPEQEVTAEPAMPHLAAPNFYTDVTPETTKPKANKTISEPKKMPQRGASSTQNKK